MKNVCKVRRDAGGGWYVCERGQDVWDWVAEPVYKSQADACAAAAARGLEVVYIEPPGDNRRIPLDKNARM